MTPVSLCAAGFALGPSLRAARQARPAAFRLPAGPPESTRGSGPAAVPWPTWLRLLEPVRASVRPSLRPAPVARAHSRRRQFSRPSSWTLRSRRAEITSSRSFTIPLLSTACAQSCRLRAGLQPARLLCPRASPGRSRGGCRALRQGPSSPRGCAGLSRAGGFSGSAVAKSLPATWETPVQLLGREGPLEQGQATHSSMFGLPLWLSW